MMNKPFFNVQYMLYLTYMPKSVKLSQRSASGSQLTAQNTISRAKLCKFCKAPVVMHKQAHPKLDLSQITPNIYIGTNACCTTHFDERLRALGITADISLEAERLDAPHGAKYYLWLPTRDHFPPTKIQLESGIAFLRELVKNKVKVYIHCKHGHGRAPTFVAAFLISEQKITPEQAVKSITGKRPITHLTPKQWRALRQIYRYARY